MFNSAWYLSLIKPSFSPPNWLYAPVWTLLYILIFASLVFYLSADSPYKKTGTLFFSIQMFLNIIWPPVFFGLKSILGGLIVVILLDIFIVLTIWKFYQCFKIAGIVLIPYLIWVLFATYLNIGYLILN